MRGVNYFNISCRQVLLMEYDICNDWRLADEGNPRWQARVKFCQTYDGYNTLCSCHKPFVIREYNTNNNSKSNSSDVSTN